MSEAKAYRAWLCDLDGTLYRARGLRLLMGTELMLFGLPELKTIRVFRQEHERLRQHSHAQHADRYDSPFDQQVARAATRLELDESLVRRSVARWMVERPSRWLRRFRRDELCREISEFRAAGGKTALVSDYPARRKLRALEIEALFDVVVANGEPGGPSALKPAPQGYLKAAAQLGVSPAECLVLGDRADADGLAAQAAGMGFRLIG